MEHIWQQWRDNNTSLGIFEPKVVSELIVKKSKTKKWTDEELALLNQLSFGEKRWGIYKKKPLKKIPFDFSFKFRCSNPDCKGHAPKITDWELYQAYRNFSVKYGEERGIQVLKEKYQSIFNNNKRRTLFITGTTHQQHRFGKFILIGILGIHKIKEEQLTLFD